MILFCNLVRVYVHKYVMISVAAVRSRFNG